MEHENQNVSPDRSVDFWEQQIIERYQKKSSEQFMLIVEILLTKLKLKDRMFGTKTILVNSIN